jgi:transcriptional regulator with XRE-family HTH domain
MTQKQLAKLSGMAQPRISAMEQPGATKFNLETLIRVASALNVALKVEFVSFSDMLEWESTYSQDSFNVVTLDDDFQFLNPGLLYDRIEATEELTGSPNVFFAHRACTPVPFVRAQNFIVAGDARQSFFTLIQPEEELVPAACFLPSVQQMGEATYDS